MTAPNERTVGVRRLVALAIRRPFTQVPLRESRSSISRAILDRPDHRVPPRHPGIIDHHVSLLPPEHQPGAHLEAATRERAVAEDQGEHRAVLHGRWAPAATCSRRLNARAVCGRRSGSLASACRTAHDTAEGTSERPATGSGGSCRRCATPTCRTLLPANGGRPARVSNATQ